MSFTGNKTRHGLNAKGIPNQKSFASQVSRVVDIPPSNWGGTKGTIFYKKDEINVKYMALDRPMPMGEKAKMFDPIKNLEVVQRETTVNLNKRKQGKNYGLYYVHLDGKETKVPFGTNVILQDENGMIVGESVYNKVVDKKGNTTKYFPKPQVLKNIQALTITPQNIRGMSEPDIVNVVGKNVYTVIPIEKSDNPKLFKLMKGLYDRKEAIYIPHFLMKNSSSSPAAVFIPQKDGDNLRLVVKVGGVIEEKGYVSKMK